MRQRLSLVVVCGLFLLAAASAQEAQKQKKVLKNADIVLMVQNHFDDETLLKIIEVSDSDFDISGDSLIEMKNQGVSSAVLRAMLQATQRKRRAAATASPAPSADSPLTDHAPPAASTTATSAGSAPPTTRTAPDTSTSGPTAAPDGFAAMPSRGAMGGMINSQQMAAMQSQMNAMGMGGMLGGMFSMSYSAEQMPHVFLMGELINGKQEVPPSTAQIAQSKFKGGPSAGGTMLRSLATEGLSFAAMGAGPAGMMAMSAFSIGSGFMPGMRPGTPSLTYVWGLPGRKSSRDLTNLTPQFELGYGDIPGVNPDGYEPAVVKLVPTKDNYRLVGATRTKMNAKSMMSGGMEQGKWVSEERWPTRLDKEERGFYILHVDQPLDPGEYAVVLRPVKGYKPIPSAFGGGAQVFYSVWDFSVPGTPSEDAGKKKKK